MNTQRPLTRAGGYVIVASVVSVGVSVQGAHAQAVFTVRPSIGLTQVHDSNLFYAASDRQADLITRITPALETEYRALPLQLFGRGTFDVEGFATHPELTRMDARQQAAIELAYRVSPRLSLAADAELSRTRTPGEFSAETGLALPRARASRTAAHALLKDKLDLRTDGLIEYAFRQDRIEGGLTVDTHSAAARANRRWSSRVSVRLDYRVEQYLFGSGGTTSSATTHSLGAGWTRAMTPRASLTIAAGPRLTDGSLAPDLSASLGYCLPKTDLSLTYGRAQTTVIGVAAPVDTESVTGTATWSWRKGFNVRLAPAFLQSHVDGLRANVYRLAIEFVRPVAKNVSLNVAFDSTVQHGHLHPIRAGERIVRQSALVRLVAAPFGRAR